MSGNDKNGIEMVLGDAFRKMNVDQAQTIREAYYKAIEGLSTLAGAIEIGKPRLVGAIDHALIGERLLACAALETMEKSFLGRIL